MTNNAQGLTQQGFQKSQVQSDERSLFHIRNGGLELVKWLALLAMVVDHVDAVFFGREWGTWATAAGRIAFPLFCLVIAANISRPVSSFDGLIGRLPIFGAFALPAHQALIHPASLAPLNVMFLFLFAVLAVRDWDRFNGWRAIGFVVLGALCAEYGFPGMAFVLASVWVFRGGGVPAWLLQMLAMLGLCLDNGNAWAVLAFPLWLLAYVDVPMPRWRWAFYVFYPAHLWLLWALGAAR